MSVWLRIPPPSRMRVVGISDLGTIARMYFICDCPLVSVSKTATSTMNTKLAEIEVEHEGRRIKVARGVNLTTTLTTDLPQGEPLGAERPDPLELLQA